MNNIYYEVVFILNEFETGTLFYVNNGHWNGMIVESNGIKEIITGVDVKYIKENIQTITYPLVYKNIIPYSRLLDGSLEYEIIGNASYLLEVIDDEERQAKETLQLSKMKRNGIVNLFKEYNISVEKGRLYGEQRRNLE